MSDLNDFFAKKDRKKKKAASRSAQSAAAETKKAAEAPTETAAGPPPAPPPPKQPDDGWIEIEDPRGAQVNTGGRTVVEFKRGVEDNENKPDGAVPTEKFSGWAKAENEEPAVGEEGASNQEKAPSAAFPTLADAANAPQVPTSRGKASTTSGTYAPASTRRRFINSNSEALRKKLAERAALNK